MAAFKHEVNIATCMKKVKVTLIGHNSNQSDTKAMEK